MDILGYRPILRSPWLKENWLKFWAGGWIFGRFGWDFWLFLSAKCDEGRGIHRLSPIKLHGCWVYRLFTIGLAVLRSPC